MVHVNLHLYVVLGLAFLHAFFVDVSPRLIVVRFLLTDHRFVFVARHAEKYAIETAAEMAGNVLDAPLLTRVLVHFPNGQPCSTQPSVHLCFFALPTIKQTQQTSRVFSGFAVPKDIPKVPLAGMAD